MCIRTRVYFVESSCNRRRHHRDYRASLATKRTRADEFDTIGITNAHSPKEWVTIFSSHRTIDGSIRYGHSFEADLNDIFLLGRPTGQGCSYVEFNYRRNTERSSASCGHCRKVNLSPAHKCRWRRRSLPNIITYGWTKINVHVMKTESIRSGDILLWSVWKSSLVLCSFDDQSIGFSRGHHSASIESDKRERSGVGSLKLCTRQGTKRESHK